MLTRDAPQSILDHLGADSATSEEEHFRLSLVMLDLERAHWLLRAYLRVRLGKIEHFSQLVCSTPSEIRKMSSLEREYAKQYVCMRRSSSTAQTDADAAPAALAAGSNGYVSSTSRRRCSIYCPRMYAGSMMPPWTALAWVTCVSMQSKPARAIQRPYGGDRATTLRAQSTVTVK